MSGIQGNVGARAGDDSNALEQNALEQTEVSAGAAGAGASSLNETYENNGGLNERRRLRRLVIVDPNASAGASTGAGAGAARNIGAIFSGFWAGIDSLIASLKQKDDFGEEDSVIKSKLNEIRLDPDTIETITAKLSELQQYRDGSNIDGKTIANAETCRTDTNISLKSICKGPQYILRATVSDIHDDIDRTLKLIQPVTDRIATDELITATGLNPYFPGLGVRDLRFVPFVEGGAGVDI